VHVKKRDAAEQNQNNRLSTLQLLVRQLRVGKAHALLAIDTSLQPETSYSRRLKMTKALIMAAILAMSLTACSKPGDSGAASSGGTPPAGLSQLGGHTK
jgi:hypothetical protein